MNMQRLSFGLTVVNLILLGAILLSRSEPALANTSPVLRGSGLEIVDDRGRVRASIKVQPAETFEPTGRRYPESVVLRLIDQNGRPEVKVMASVEGGGLSLVGESDETQAQLHADGNNSQLRLTNKAGGRQLVRP
jgi:hypothetical protein